MHPVLKACCARRADSPPICPKGSPTHLYTRREPAFQPTAHDGTGAAVTGGGSLPAALLAKLESLRLAGKGAE